MIDITATNSTQNTFVPITRFYHGEGEADKIFDEVKEAGYKIVVKNDTPACVLIAPEIYQEMIEMLVDQHLLELAEERERNRTEKTIPADEVYKKFRIVPNESDDDIPMEYGVDFE